MFNHLVKLQENIDNITKLEVTSPRVIKDEMVTVILDVSKVVEKSRETGESREGGLCLMP